MINYTGEGPYKIAVVIPRYGLVGGAEQYVTEVTDRIAHDPSFNVHVFAHKWVSSNPKVTFHKVPVISHPRFLEPLTFAYFTEKMISRENFDLVHSHDRIFSSHIFTMHGIPHYLWVREIRKRRPHLHDLVIAWLEKKLVKSGRCGFFLAVSSLVKEKFLEAYPEIEEERVIVVPPGIDHRPFQELDSSLCRRDIRGRYGIGDKEVVLLFVGMNFEIKGLDRLLKVLVNVDKIVESTGKGRWRLLVVGKGKIGKYKKVAEKLGLAGKVLFTDVLKKSELLKVYLACDIFCMLSYFDTFGLVVLEAMAAGLPVVISERVGAKDVVKEGVNGFVIDDNESPQDCAEKLVALFASAKRAEMGQKAREKALSLSWENTAECLKNIYRAAGRNFFDI